MGPVARLENNFMWSVQTRLGLSPFAALGIVLGVSCLAPACLLALCAWRCCCPNASLYPRATYYKRHFDEEDEADAQKGGPNGNSPSSVTCLMGVGRTSASRSGPIYSA